MTDTNKTLADELADAAIIVNSDGPISKFASCEWDDMNEDGKVWLAAIVAEAKASALRTATNAAEPSEAVVEALKAAEKRFVEYAEMHGEKLFDGSLTEAQRNTVRAKVDRNLKYAHDCHAALASAPQNAPMMGEEEAIARQFHETYERLAPQFGYETRGDTKQFDPTSPNGKLMIGVCAALTRPSPDADRIGEAERLLRMAKAWMGQVLHSKDFPFDARQTARQHHQDLDAFLARQGEA